MVVRYKTEYGTNFKIDGDLTRVLEITGGGKDYVMHWLRDKLRKMENGQIKVVKVSSGERDWEQEEKIKKQLWEDINVNEYPKGIDFEDKSEWVKTPIRDTTICYWQELRSPSPPPKPTCKPS